jgi:hypothetical protein
MSDDVIQRIKAIAAQVRKSLLGGGGLQPDEDEDWENDRLIGLCLEASTVLHSHLEREYECRVVRGMFQVDSPNEEFYDDWDVDEWDSEEQMEQAKLNPLHYWVEVRRPGRPALVVDVSASQFNSEIDAELDHQPDVLVAPHVDCPRHQKRRGGHWRRRHDRVVPRSERRAAHAQRLLGAS